MSYTLPEKQKGHDSVCVEKWLKRGGFMYQLGLKRRLKCASQVKKRKYIPSKENNPLSVAWIRQRANCVIFVVCPP